MLLPALREGERRSGAIQYKISRQSPKLCYLNRPLFRVDTWLRPLSAFPGPDPGEGTAAAGNMKSAAKRQRAGSPSPSSDRSGFRADTRP